jgi:hypothetical protein
MDALFLLLTAALWFATVLLVWGLARLDAPAGERP